MTTSVIIEHSSERGSGDCESMKKRASINETILNSTQPVHIQINQQNIVKKNKVLRWLTKYIPYHVSTHNITHKHTTHT